MSYNHVKVGHSYDCPGRGWRATVLAVKRTWAGYEVVEYDAHLIATGELSHRGTLTPPEFRARYNVEVAVEPKL